MRARFPRQAVAVLTVTSLTLASVLFAGCGRPGAKGNGVPDAGPVRLGPEDVATVRREVLRTGPRISGTLEARVQAAVRAELAGAVEEVRVDLGQPVRRGELLARIEETGVRDAAASARAAVRAAEEDLSVAERQAARTQALVSAGALAERELETARAAASSARARLAQAKAQLAQAARQLDAATVRAPMDGVVSARAVSVGDVVAPGAPLFTIIDPSTIRLEAAVATEELAGLEVGAPVTFEVRGYPEQTFTGRVERVAPAADPTTRQIPILVSVPNREGRLQAGLFAEGRIATEAREGWVVPLSAVSTARQTPTVLRVREGQLQEVAVKLGARDEPGGRVEVSGPFDSGDWVVVGAARQLEPGTPVVVVARDHGAEDGD